MECTVLARVGRCLRPAPLTRRATSACVGDPDPEWWVESERDPTALGRGSPEDEARGDAEEEERRGVAEDARRGPPRPGASLDMVCRGVSAGVAPCCCVCAIHFHWGFASCSRNVVNFPRFGRMAHSAAQRRRTNYSTQRRALCQLQHELSTPAPSTSPPIPCTTPGSTVLPRANISIL